MFEVLFSIIKYLESFPVLFVFVRLAWVLSLLLVVYSTPFWGLLLWTALGFLIGFFGQKKKTEIHMFGDF